jgi:hypothetical protein
LGALDTSETALFPLVGLTDQDRKFSLAAQLVDSIRRIKYVETISARARSPNLHTPYSGSFQPLSGAAVLNKAGLTDEAYWLVYLATHFGKHKHDGWNLVEDFYGNFGQGGIWDWKNASEDPDAIAMCLAAAYPDITKEGR